MRGYARSMNRYVGFARVRYTGWARRDGREAEGGGLLNRYRAKSSIEGSNPSLSARQSAYPLSFVQRNIYIYRRMTACLASISPTAINLMAPFTHCLSKHLPARSEFAKVCFSYY